MRKSKFPVVRHAQAPARIEVADAAVIGALHNGIGTVAAAVVADNDFQPLVVLRRSGAKRRFKHTSAFATLRPVMLSLGSSRQLWHDATLVSRDIVLYGNLPSKKFYSDAELTVADVQRLSRELLEGMAAANHPFILGSECDVLSVPGCEQTIKSKVRAMLECS